MVKILTAFQKLVKMFLVFEGVLDMQNMYTSCTNCDKPLTEEDIERNKELENYYYTICAECVDKFTDRVLDILSEE